MAGNVEFLIVGKEQFFCRTVLAGNREDLTTQLLQRNIGDPGKTAGSVLIPLSTGGRFEHNRIGKDGRRHHTCHFFRGQNALFLIHTGNDGIGRAHRLIADIDRIGGLDIRQAVVIDDLQNIRLFQAGNGLGSFVMVHQHHPFSPGTEQMIPGQKAYYLFAFIQNRIAGMTVLQHLLPDLVHPVFQMEGNDTVSTANTTDGGRLEDHPGSTVSIEGGGNNAGGSINIAQIFSRLCLAKNKTVHLHPDGAFDHIRLVAAQNNTLGILEQQVFPVLGQRNGNLSGYIVGSLSGCAHKLTLQHRKQVEQRNRLQKARIGHFHIVACHIFPGKHTIQGAIFVGNRQSGNGTIAHQLLPGTTQMDRLAQQGRCVKFQVLDLGKHIVDPLGRFTAKTVQHDLCLIRNVTQASRHILSVSKGISQGRIGHCRHNRVRIRVPVTGNINRFHKIPPNVFHQDIHSLLSLYPHCAQIARKKKRSAGFGIAFSSISV